MNAIVKKLFSNDNDKETVFTVDWSHPGRYPILNQVSMSAHTDPAYWNGASLFVLEKI